VVLRGLLPLWISSTLLDGGSLKQRAVRGTVEFFGARAHPYTQHDIMKGLAANVGRDLEDMASWERNILREQGGEDLVALQDKKAEAGDPDAKYWQRVDQLREDTNAKLQGLTARLSSTTDELYRAPNRQGRIRSIYFAIVSELAIARKELDYSMNKYQGDTEIDEQDPDKVARALWYDAYDEYKRDDGTVDFFKVDQRHRQILLHYPGSEAYIIRDTHIYTPPEPLIPFLPVKTQVNIRKAQQAREQFIAENWGNP